MQYDVSFGRLNRTARPPSAGTKFRLALLGDFSGRANAGRLDTGAKLAARKPVKVDVDNLDDVLAKLSPTLSLPMDEDGAAVEIKIESLDDFHPDQLAEAVDFFGELRTLRRNLSSKQGFDRAAKQVLSWGGEEPLPPPPRRARGSAVDTGRKLSDFARLTGRPSAAEAAEASAADLVRRLVGPFIVPARDARQDQLTARVDEALSAAMRRVLHHPDFQAAEAIWRGVEFLVRRIETGAKMEIVLYDISAEEFAADLASSDALDKSALYNLLVEQPAQDAHQGPLSALIGLYGFELSPPHADLLGRMATLAAAAGAPFVAGIGPDALKTPMHEQNPLIREAWAALRELPASAYLGLAAPRFLLRMPYGKKSDPIDAFAFEEFTRQGGLSGMLWGHPALLPALQLARTFEKQGKAMQLGSVMNAGDMPFYVYYDADGDQTALPCTERLFTEKQAVAVTNFGVMPLLSLRGRPEVRLGSFASLAGPPLAGFWAPADTSAKPAPAPQAAAPTAAPAQAAPAEPAAEAPADEMPDLDALLAGLNAAPEPAAPAAQEAAPAPEPAAEPEAEAELDLDALLASLSAEPEPTPAGETEPDLDALLASLN